MEKQLKISIITPSYNQGQYIEETITSVINQGYTNYELIIIDGGSSDNTLEVIKKYEKEITYWVSEKDSGQADAINKGIRIASGDIFNWINSDDYLNPGALQTIADFFSSNPQKNVVCGYTRCFFDEDNSTSHTYRMGLKETPTETMLNIKMNQPGTFYRMDIIRSLQGVNESLRYVFDNELWLRYLSRFGTKNIGTCNQVLAQFRLHRDSKTVFDGYTRFKEEENAIWEFLVKELRLNSAIVACMQQTNLLNRYNPGGWDFKYLDKGTLEKAFADKYLISLIEKGTFSQARKGFIYRLKQKTFKVNRLNVSAFARLFIWPGFLKY